MDTLLNVGLSNAAVATALALAAVAVGCVCRRPALVHSLWLLVLLKLVTPPLVSVPVSWPAAEGPPAPETPAPAPAEEAVPDDPTPVVTLPGGEFAEEPGDVFLLETPPPASLPRTAPPPERPAESAPVGPPLWQRVSWQAAVTAAWLAGSAAWLCVALWRVYRFHRLLRHARPAPAALQNQARRMAERVGLASCPGVYLVPGRLSPMLWSLGGAPRLLLSAGLWERLDDEQRATLLAHELAHLRRRDHWVRFLEFVVTGLYWWHPVVWWARRELRQAEEECCDAWVVWALPRAAKAYATALVETLDFLSGAQGPLPLGASGLGHIHDLRRRLTMIMQGTTPRGLTWRGAVAVLGLAAMLLPVLPTWAQPGPKDAPRRERGGDGDRKADLDKARAEVQKLQAELDRMKADMAAAQARLKKAQDHLAQMEGKGREEGEVIIMFRDKDGNTRRVELKDIDLDIIKKGGDVLRGKFDWQVSPGTPGPRFGPSGDRPGQSSGPPQPDRRMQDVEKRLDQLMREIENIRKELRGGRGPEAPRGPDAPGGERRQYYERRDRGSPDGGDVDIIIEKGPKPDVRPLTPRDR